MLEVARRDGRARTVSWEPEEGRRVQTPALVLPDVPQCPRPAWAEVMIGQAPVDFPGVSLVSGGTWFHPEDRTGALVVPPIEPAPTTTVQTVLVGDELAVFHDAGGWASNPANVIEALIEARTTATPARVLWAPALGDPADVALWAYLGVDLFDASPLLLAAYRGYALTTDGALTAADAGTLLGDGTVWTTKQLVAHNLEAMHREILKVRAAIENGTLRNLVERRLYARPGMVETLRRFDREHSYLEAATPENRNGPLPCMTSDSLWMPEIERFRRRMRTEYSPPALADILVLLPCSARKPYRLSPSHRRFARTLDDSGLRHRVHEVMVTSPLGLVPREIEESYPACAYDVPVTGMWSADEIQVIRIQVEALVATGQYKHILVHTDAKTYEAIADLMPGAIHTAPTRPGDYNDLQGLKATLREYKIKGEDPFRAGKARKQADLHAIATYQFGKAAADALFKDTYARGSWPYVKLFAKDGTQLGMTTADRGILSLTLEGGERIRTLVPVVRIGDFELKKTGSLFAVGVAEAQAGVRPGSEIVVVQDDAAATDGSGQRLVGVGAALMSGEEMRHLRRGVAVNLRHVAKKGWMPGEGAPGSKDVGAMEVNA